jgi:hypothetical protein
MAGGDEKADISIFSLFSPHPPGHQGYLTGRETEACNYYYEFGIFFGLSLGGVVNSIVPICGVTFGSNHQDHIFPYIRLILYLVLCDLTVYPSAVP